MQISDLTIDYLFQISIHYIFMVKQARLGVGLLLESVFRWIHHVHEIIDVMKSWKNKTVDTAGLCVGHHLTIVSMTIHRWSYLIVRIGALNAGLAVHALPWVRLDDGDHLRRQFKAGWMTWFTVLYQYSCLINPLTAVSWGSGYKFCVKLYSEPAIRIEHYMQKRAVSRRPW